MRQEKIGGQGYSVQSGAVYMLAGRHYDHKNRYEIRLMLWKPPPPPTYPQFIQWVQEGLVQEEADVMCNAGHDLPGLCRLGKRYDILPPVLQFKT
jgi:hypothetical protein